MGPGIVVGLIVGDGARQHPSRHSQLQACRFSVLAVQCPLMPKTLVEGNAIGAFRTQIAELSTGIVLVIVTHTECEVNADGCSHGIADKRGLWDYYARNNCTPHKTT